MITLQVNKAEIVAWVYSLQVIPCTPGNHPHSFQLAVCDQSETGELAAPLPATQDTSQLNRAEVSPDMAPGELNGSSQLDATLSL